jgi:hypothetical protein
MEISNNINQLNPIKCSNQNCFYNNWLISTQQKPQNTLSANEEQKLISNHQLLNQYDIKKQSQNNEIDKIKCRQMLICLLMQDCSIDFFEAALKHCQELVSAIEVTLYLSLGDLLQNALEDQSQAIATKLAIYIQKKQQTIEYDHMYHSLYHALTKNYTNIVDILLELKTIPNTPILCQHISTCWNSIMCCIKKEDIYNSVFNFITQNFLTFEQKRNFLLKLFSTTEYLYNNQDIFANILTHMVNEISRKANEI